MAQQTINVGTVANDGTGDSLRSSFTKTNGNFTELYGLGASYQPLDADLTALAALSGTGVIYYRSAANTWATVTIGANLSFTAGTLATTGLLTTAAAGTTYQPIDGDLTALAAVTGTSTIYYRSAADTWSPVTIGGNLTFTTGTLNTAVTPQPLDADLTSLAAASATNTIYYRSVANTWSPVSIGGNMTFSGGVLDSVTPSVVTDPELLAIANLTSAADQVPYFTGSGTASLMTVTPAARDVLDDLTTAAMLTTLGAQPLDADLTALAAVAGTNTIYYRSAANVWSPVTFGTTLTFSGGVINTTGLLTSANAASTYQPLDADLTALAALAGTNTIYYRSAANTWSAVSLGSTISFSGGVLDTTGVVTTAGGAVTYQPLDADLTALSGLAGTNTIYYRSAANTWTAVTVGSGLSFSAGTLNTAVTPQASDAELTAIAGLVSAADQVPYFTGSGTAALMTVTSAARGVLDDTSTANMLTTLGAQPADAELTAIAGLTSVADRLPYFTGAGTAALATFTAFGRSLVDDADAAAARTTLGALALTGGTLTDGLTITDATTYTNLTLGGSAIPGIKYAPTTGSTQNALVAQTGDVYQISNSGVINFLKFDLGTAALTLSASPATADNTTKVATTGYVKSNLASYQPLDAALTAMSGLVTAADKMAYYTALDVVSTTTLTSFARTLLDDADATTMRGTLGVQPAGSYQPLDADLTAIAGLTTGADLVPYFTGAGAASTMTVTAAARGVINQTTTALMRTALGAQSLDAGLTAYAGVATAADKMMYYSGVDVPVAIPLTPFARTLLDDADAAAMRATIGALAEGAFRKIVDPDEFASGADDTVRLQAAIDYGAANHIPIVLSRTYFVSEASVGAGYCLLITDSVIMEGLSSGASLLTGGDRQLFAKISPGASVGSGVDIIKLKGSGGSALNHVILRNFAIGSTAAVRARHGIYIETFAQGVAHPGGVDEDFGHGLFERLCIWETNGRSIFHYNDGSNAHGGMYLTTFRDCVLVKDIRMERSGSCNVIDHCYIYGCDPTGVSIYYSQIAGGTGFTVVECNIADWGGAIQIDSGNNIRIHRNNIELGLNRTGVNGAAIDINGFYNTVNGVYIHNNYIANLPNSTSSLTTNVRIHNCIGAYIEGNFWTANSTQPANGQWVLVTSLASNTYVSEAQSGNWYTQFSTPTKWINNSGSKTKSQFNLLQRWVTASPIVVNLIDTVLNCNITAGSPTCTLPDSVSRTGQPITIKDATGQFGAHPLTLSCFSTQSIDGATTKVLNTPFQSITLRPYNDGVGVGWSVE